MVKPMVWQWDAKAPHLLVATEMSEDGSAIDTTNIVMALTSPARRMLRPEHALMIEVAPVFWEMRHSMMRAIAHQSQCAECGNDEGVQCNVAVSIDDTVNVYWELANSLIAGNSDAIEVFALQMAEAHEMSIPNEMKGK